MTKYNREIEIVHRERTEDCILYIVQYFSDGRIKKDHVREIYMLLVMGETGNYCRIKGKNILGIHMQLTL
jgi:hypothetical protein